MRMRRYRREIALTREALKRFINHKDGKTYMPLGANFERTDWLIELNKDYFLARSVIEGTGIFAQATPEEVLAAEMLLGICKYKHLCEAIAREDFIDFPDISTGEHEKTAYELEKVIDSYFPGICKIMNKHELLETVSPNKVNAGAEDQGEMEATRFTPKLEMQKQAILKCLHDKGYDRLKLNPFKNGKEDKDRTSIRLSLISDTQLFPSKKSFDDAWRHLIDSEEIAYKRQ